MLCIDALFDYLIFICRTELCGGLSSPADPSTVLPKHRPNDFVPSTKLIVAMLRSSPVMDIFIYNPSYPLFPWLSRIFAVLVKIDQLKWSLTLCTIFSMLEYIFTTKQPSIQDLPRVLPTVWWEGTEKVRFLYIFLIAYCNLTTRHPVKGRQIETDNEWQNQPFEERNGGAWPMFSGIMWAVC